MGLGALFANFLVVFLLICYFFVFFLTTRFILGGGRQQKSSLNISKLIYNIWKFICIYTRDVISQLQEFFGWIWLLTGDSNRLPISQGSPIRTTPSQGSRRPRQLVSLLKVPCQRERPGHTTWGHSRKKKKKSLFSWRASLICFFSFHNEF